MGLASALFEVAALTGRPEVGYRVRSAVGTRDEVVDVLGGRAAVHTALPKNRNTAWRVLRHWRVEPGRAWRGQ
jgi:hypothetical protein